MLGSLTVDRQISRIQALTDLLRRARLHCFSMNNVRLRHLGRPWLVVGAVALLAFAASPSRALAATIFIDFDSFDLVDGIDGDPIGNTFSGATFSNAILLRSGAAPTDPGLLFELEFPPRSDFNVAGDEGGPIRIDFSPLIVSFSGFFTYAVPLTVEAFDASDNPLGSVLSQFTENFVSSGNAPNELLQLAVPNISYVVITGDPAGGSFVVDDVTFEQAAVMPEPATLLLFATGLAAVARRRFGPRS